MIYQSRPAEAITFRELFSNQATLHANGGILVGSPLIQDGIRLDGSTQYVTFPVSSLFQSLTFLTIKIEFWPDNDYDVDSVQTLCSSTSDHYYLYKDNNAANNVLGIILGGTTITTIASSTYGTYWRQLDRNVLIVSSDGITTNAWLNGAQILTADATTWIPTNPVTLYIGSKADLSGKFAGVISDVSVHHCVMVQADCSAIQDHSLFTYPNSADLWADMVTAVIDGSNDRTPDKSRRGKTILLGNGAGTGTPSFSDPGFLFDGSSNYMTLPTAPTGDFTIVTKRSEDIAPVFENDLTTRNKIATSGQFSGTLEFYGEWPYLLSPIQQADLEYRLRGIR